MQLEYGHIYDPRFSQSLQKIATAQLHGPTLKHVVKLVKTYEEHIKMVQKQYVELAKQHAAVDEKGELITDADGKFDILKGKEQDWNKAVTELMKTPVPVKKLDFENLVNCGVKMSALDVDTLKPILENI